GEGLTGERTRDEVLREGVDLRLRAEGADNDEVDRQEHEERDEDRQRVHPGPPQHIPPRAPPPPHHWRSCRGGLLYGGGHTYLPPCPPSVTRRGKGGLILNARATPHCSRKPQRRERVPLPRGKGTGVRSPSQPLLLVTHAEGPQVDDHHDDRDNEND